MSKSYAAPQILSLPAASATVDNEAWIAAVVAHILACTVAFVIATCTYCGTINDYYACFQSVVNMVNYGTC